MARTLVLFAFIFLAYPLISFSQIIFPSNLDSILAGKEIVFKFKIKTTSLQKLEFSLNGLNWYEIGKFFNREDFNWFPPLIDVDSIFFRYESYNFTQPVKVWSISNGHSGEITSIDILPDDSIFLSTSFDGRLFLWSLNTTQKVDSFIHSSRTLSARIFPNSRKVVFSSDSSVYYYDFSNPVLLSKVWAGSGFVRTIAVCPLKKLCAFASSKGEIVVLDSNLNVVKNFSIPREIYSIALSTSCQMIAVGDYNGFVSIYDFATGEQLFEFSTNRDSSFKNVVWSVSFDIADSLVVVGGIDGKIRIYNLNTKNLEYSFPSHTFHIRKAEFCDYAPVATSASLDSTVYQVLFPFNIPIHFPLKEEAAITILKKIDGGRYFLLGLRNGTIVFYKNFDYEHILHHINLPYFIPIVAKCQSFQSIAGQMVSFPIILKNVYEIPLQRFHSDSSFAILKVPKEHFGVFKPEKGKLLFGSIDTIYSNLRSIGVLDTFAVVQAYTLHPWGERRESFAIQDMNFRGKRNIFWILDTSSVEIVEKCKPLTNLMKFQLMPKVSFDVDKDFIDEELTIKVSTEKAIFCKFVMINSINGNCSTLFEGEVPLGETILEFDVSNFSSGVYVLLIDAYYLRLAKNLIVLH